MPGQPEPQREFAAHLRAWRVDCGKPTEQEIARRMHCGRTTVSDLLAGRRFPTWGQAWALVTACRGENLGVSQATWLARWRTASRELDELRYGLSTRSTSSLGSEERPSIAVDSDRILSEAFSLEETSTSWIAATWYRDNPEFYRAAAERVRRARSEIRVTYVRQYPPTVFTTPASGDYFQAIIDWARQPDDNQRSVRRIVGVPHSEGLPDHAMLDWIRQHREDTADILTYEANILPWHAAGDGLNMALIDEDVAFLAFSGSGRQKLNGFSVADATFVGYFIGHFEQLWSTLTPLQTYLRDIRPDS